jgi:hypothetical protein
MAGLVPAIHDLFSAWAKDVDARNTYAHDVGKLGDENWHWVSQGLNPPDNFCHFSSY